MTDQTESNAPKEPAGGIPQAVAEELAQLAAEVRQMEQKASRSWKTTAIGFIVLLAVIATYLGLLVYRPIKNLLDEESIVAMAFTHIDSMLVNSGAKALSDPQIVDWAVQQLAKQAPTLMKDQAQPYIQDTIKRLPEWRKQIVEQVTQKGPGALDKGIEAAQNQFLPTVRQRLVDGAITEANTRLDAIQDQMDAVVGGIIEGNIQNMKDLNPENVDVLKRAMEDSMEEKLAPILDPMFEGISTSVERTHSGLSDLVAKLQAGTLTHEDKLEIGLIQLTNALFRLKATTPEAGGVGLWQQIQDIIQQAGAPQGGAVVPALGVTPMAAPSTMPRPEAIQRSIAAMEQALKAPDLSDENRQKLQQQIENAKKQLETMKSQPQGMAPAAAPMPANMPSALERAQAAVEGMQKQLQNPDLSDQARKALQEQLDNAKKQLETMKSQPQGMAPAAAPMPANMPSALERTKAAVEGMQKQLQNPDLNDQARKAIQQQLDNAKKQLEELQANE